MHFCWILNPFFLKFLLNPLVSLGNLFVQIFPKFLKITGIFEIPYVPLKIRPNFETNTSSHISNTCLPFQWSALPQIISSLLYLWELSVLLISWPTDYPQVCSWGKGFHIQILLWLMNKDHLRKCENCWSVWGVFSCVCWRCFQHWVNELSENNSYESPLNHTSNKKTVIRKVKYNVLDTWP